METSENKQDRMQRQLRRVVTAGLAGITVWFDSFCACLWLGLVVGSGAWFECRTLSLRDRLLAQLLIRAFVEYALGTGGPWAAFPRSRIRPWANPVLRALNML